MSEEIHWCRICGHRIWVKKSVDRGIGPVCWAKRQKEGEPEEAEGNG